jgi:UDP-sulfoquinovose synthase
MFPRQAGSLYHTTKIMDTDLLWFYVRTWDLRVTDLMQGPVYGFVTPENKQDDRLLPLFNYDGILGTVLNRFVVQAVSGFPLTVYGRGGQTRGYLNILDTIACVRLAVENPAAAGEHRIFNQFTETFSVLDLAEKVRRVGAQLGFEVEVRSIENPRVESEEHYYNPVLRHLMDLGLEPHPLTDEVLAEIFERVIAHKERIDERVIMPEVQWR